ncbi:hypothetical protein B0H10DRAFT_338291 [Mycena sp. CBHHK59/15]|nr:hypothetical protein B0H10DRAFT_338291 [Mycena sp. CBHHK59/15]
MGDQEKGTAPGTTADGTDEAFAAKLWAVYISEAEKYDKALVESWRSDMDGMLIFAGLFSASLTAFLIESYKTLTPDSGDMTVLLLSQISQQLAASTNRTVFDVPAPTSFKPPATSLVCNTLWFISLGLSLACALIATLLEQWARDFLHRADMRSAPIIRARIFAYLYYGLKRFNMDTVVEIIPLLLHASLVFFFAGLIAFLAPVNHLVMAIAAVLLVIVVAVYSVLTILPLCYLDCPYRTPVSGAFWRLVQWFGALRHQRYPNADSKTDDTSQITMVEAMARRAVEPSQARESRDARALVWTVKSLADDAGFESFVEGIPDAVWGPRGRRHTYDNLLRSLVNDPDVCLRKRTERLLRSCQSGILSPEAKWRREITCFKSLCTIGSLSSDRIPSIESDVFLPYMSPDVHKLCPNITHLPPDITHYLVSAWTLTRWSMLCGINSRLAQLQTSLVDVGDVRVSDILSFMQEIEDTRIFRIYFQILHTTPSPEKEPASVLIPLINQEIQGFLANGPYLLLFDYYATSAKLDSLPYEFGNTEATLVSQTSPIPHNAQGYHNHVFSSIVYNHMDKMNGTTEDHWIDIILRRMISWQKTGDLDFPRGMVQYLNERISEPAVREMATTYEEFLCSGLGASLTAAGDLPVDRDLESKGIHQVLTALWVVMTNAQHAAFPIPLCESTLTAVAQADLRMDVHSESASASVIAVLRMRTLHQLSLTLPWSWNTTQMGDCTVRETEVDTLARLRESLCLLARIFPSEPTPEIPIQASTRETTWEFLKPLVQVLDDRISEACLLVVTDFLERCIASELPYKATKTLSFISYMPYYASVRPSYQIRFANSIRNVVAGSNDHPELFEAIMNMTAFNGYRQGGNSWPGGLVGWISDDAARKIIKDTVARVVETSLSPHDSPALFSRVQAILQGLDSLHPTENAPDSQNYLISKVKLAG